MAFLMAGFFNPPIPKTLGEKLYQAPPFEVQSINGKTINLQQQKGKVIFLNFWAVWCPPCLAELPSVNDLYLKIKDNPNIVFISVDVDNKLDRSVLMAKNRGYSFPVYGGNTDALPAQFFSGTIPTTLVINKQGFVVFDHINRANYNDDKFFNYITDLAKQ
ncbi:MAG: TlpA family protein disulfide reductase [Mucilaginibacter sp.]|nr:TlpA family protein disulfide reductase [Mucilaginibacter sp.]